MKIYNSVKKIYEMKKKHSNPVKVASISQLHNLLGLPRPLHPLISLIDNTKINVGESRMPDAFFFDLYKVAYKVTLNGKIGYGQGYYDFDEGGLTFTAPGQVMSILEDDTEYLGLTLLFHPDFIRHHPLGKNIKKYGFFSYDTHEALHLSDSEKKIVLNLLDNVKSEMNTSIDIHSQEVLVSYIELLLSYSNRFYKRQFITRKPINTDLLTRMERLLSDYFDKEDTLTNGLPTVQYFAERLHLSAGYLGDMLRSLTGLNAQQHIHEKLIEKAKNKLSTTDLSVSEIAYELGFEHPQSFNKLFKSKTQQTPSEFRQSFN